jgi:O-antigen/teichoic acid export membrane protein
MTRLLASFGRLASNDTARQSATLMAAQALAMLGSLGLTALIARGLDVADYGVYRYALTYLAFGMTVLQFGVPYSAARLLALHDDPDMQERIVGFGALAVLLATALGVALTLGATATGRWTGLTLPVVVLVICPALFVTLGQAFVTSACQGLGRITLLAAQQVLPYLVLLPITAFQVFLLNRYSLTAALLGYVLTFTLVLYMGFRRLGVSFAGMGEVWSALNAENRRTGLPIYIGGVFGVASAQFISLWVAAFIDSTDYGQYALAVAVSAPLCVLLSSVGTVIFRSSSRLARLPCELIAMTLALGILLGAAYWIGTEWLLTAIFGDKYAPAIGTAQWLGIASLLIGFGDVLQRFLGAHGLGKRLGAVSVVTGVVAMASAAVLLPRWAVTGAIVSSLCAAATYVSLLTVLYVYFTRHAAGQSARQVDARPAAAQVEPSSPP